MKYNNIKITKRNDNRWQARYKENGSYKYVYDKSQKNCYEKLKNILKNKPIVSKNISLNKWIETWLNIYKINKIKETTLYHLKLSLNKYILKGLGPKDIKTISTLDIENFLNNIPGARTREIIYTHLKDIFTKAVKNEIIKKNVMDNVDKPKHEKKESKAFSRKEQKLFEIACQESKFKDFYLLLLFTGMRKGEMLALCREDINFEKNKISINKTLTEINTISSPKSKTSNREIPIFETCKDILLKYEKTKGRIFNISKNPVNEEFIKIITKLNLNGFTIHSLRHTFITRWTELGAPSKMIQKWVGHASNKITEQIYTKINRDYEENFVLKNSHKFDQDFDTKI